MTNLTITYHKVSELRKHNKNARTHSEFQINQIVNSINEFGWTNPILIDEHNTIIAGHGRLDAAELMGIGEVPCIGLSGLSEIQKRAYLIADNQLALNAGWDINILQAEIVALKLNDFDIDLLGFSDSEINKMLQPNDIDFPDDFSECDETELKHKCPKCGFEYD